MKRGAERARRVCDKRVRYSAAAQGAAGGGVGPMRGQPEPRRKGSRSSERCHWRRAKQKETTGGVKGAEEARIERARGGPPRRLQ